MPTIEKVDRVRQSTMQLKTPKNETRKARDAHLGGIRTKKVGKGKVHVHSSNRTSCAHARNGLTREM